MGNFPILDFQKKKPSQLEVFEELVQQELAKQGELMKHLHLMNIAIIRRLVDKKIFTPEQLVEMSYEQLANDNFVIMLNALDQKFVKDYNGGLKIKYNKTLWHRFTDWLRGAKKLEFEIKKQTDADKNAPAVSDPALPAESESPPAQAD